mgnify:CR=1 FL=1|jgi:peptide/nickel transport system permease protein|tara:strand:+ start:8533 stop:9867 length:1335 start_codon:yes stop_codon:yes gene_type:complete
MVLIKNFVVYIIYNVKTLFKFPVLSGGFLFIISILGLLAPIIAPYDPYVGDIRARLMPPGIISGQYNLQNFDLIKSKDQINQKPRWQQISDIENKSLEKLSISEGSIKIIEFKLGPKTNFVDVNRNGNYIDEIKFDQFSENCLGLSQNYCPKPNISFLNIYKEGANGFIEYRANEEIINNVNDILSLDLMVIREDTKKWSWWPSGLYLLGTDSIGRDYFSRLIYGARWNLTLMLITGFSGSIIGTSLGIISGWYAFKPKFRWIIDEVIMRIVDMTSVVPILLIAIMTTLVLGNKIWVFAIILTLFTWQNFVRIIRGKTLILRENEHINAAKVSGASTLRILIKHILPFHINDMMVIATFNCAMIITLESVLCFFEIAIPRHWTAWGNLIKLASDYWNEGWVSGTYPYRYQVAIPGGLIICTVFSLNFLGDWLRDRLDPKLRHIE